MCFWSLPQIQSSANFEVFILASCENETLFLKMLRHELVLLSSGLGGLGCGSFRREQCVIALTKPVSNSGNIKIR